MEITWLDETASTNRYLMELPEEEAPSGLVVATRKQTAGRGQRGNSWEAEPGLNLTFSVVYRPVGVEAKRQFAISQGVALAVADIVAGELPEEMGQVKVKWPNDIYVGDRKICGILIENTLAGTMVRKSVIGIGLNVNQKAFVSDAPNPVSLGQLTGREFDLEALLERLCERLEIRFSQVSSEGLGGEYFRRLWRADGMLHRWRDMADGKEFTASIEGVTSCGPIILRDAQGTLREYAFKGVKAILAGFERELY